MELEVLSKNTVVLIRPKNLFEQPSSLQKEIEQLKSSGYQYILLELLHLDWIASTEIGVLLWCFKTLSQAEAQLILLVNSPVLMDTLQTTGIDRMISICESREQALETIDSKTK